MTQQEYIELQATYEKEGQSVSGLITNVLRGRGYIDRSTMMAATYVLYMASDERVNVDSLNSFCDSMNVDAERRSFFDTSIGDDWQMVVGQRYRYNANVLKSIILFYEDRDMRFGDDGKTPVSISRLANKLFDLKDNDEIADFGIGSAAFTIETYLNNPSLSFYGIDLNGSTKAITSIRLEVLGCNATLEHGNFLDLDAGTHQFQHIFSNYPFGLRIL